MSINYGFKVCRVCLSPEPAVKLKSMFEARGERADWFQIVSGCSISYDRNKHEATICPKCSVDVKAAFTLRENVRRVDVYYFQARREEADGYNEDFGRDQTAVENNPAETVSQGKVNNAPSGSASSSGDRASRKPSAVQGGVTNMKSVATAAKPNTNTGKSFKCHVCEKSFVTKQSLRGHIKVIHEKIKDFACDLCAKKCSGKSNLRNHMVRHMSSESCPQFKCNFESCKKSFRTSDGLAQHKKFHSSASPFTCLTCQKSFKIKVLLQQHQKSHSNVRPFSCSVCLKSFKFNQDLKRHQKNSCTSKA